MKVTDEIKKGDFFMLSPSMGYTPKQCESAYQVLECWNNCMVVMSKPGTCLSMGYECFDKVEEGDLSKFKNVYYSRTFEDRRRR